MFFDKVIITLVSVSLLSFIIFIISCIKGYKDRNKFIAIGDIDYISVCIKLSGILFITPLLLTFGYCAAILPSISSYAWNINNEFINSGKEVYSEKEAISLKIIDEKIKNSYYVQKKFNNIQLTFEGNKLTTTFLKPQCEDFFYNAVQLSKSPYLNRITVNNLPLDFIVKSKANKAYECSKDKLVLSVEFKSK